MADKVIGDNTNRDFQSQFIELLDIAKKLNASYDPSVSSESDPIVVLMKEMAMMGDKLEYNKDKAARELFPSTVQQRSNAQELYDILGYRLKGWISATGYISLSLRASTALVNAVGNTVTIPKFTRLADANGLYNYVTTDTISFDLSGADDTWSDTKTVGIIEGEIKTLEVGGIDTIGISNMDENYRVYFPETNIAENGIFVSFTNTIGADFVMVDNPYMLTDDNVYSVGEGENGEKYIQFPETIVDTLGTENTLSIRYVTSRGAAGICKSRTINVLADDITVNDTTLNDSISVVQPEATINGQDPESLEQAYRNFKKTQGTFETLVTERDYESFAYEAQYDNAPLFSNVVVASRTSDLNRTVKIKTLRNWTNRDVYNLIQEENESVTPYDVWVYGLNPTGGYDVEFTPVEEGATMDILNEQILDVKAVQQVVQDPSGEKRVFWNEYTLVGTVLMKNRITASEKTEVEKNMWAALEEYLGARNVSFGEAIDYEGTVSAIINSDSRILSVILNLPSYQIKRVNISHGTADDEYLTTDEKIELVAKMILAGNVQLFSFDERFSAEFGTQQRTARTAATVEEGGSTSGGGDEVTLPLTEVKTLASGVVDNSKIDENGNVALADLQNPSVTIDTNGREIKQNEVFSLIGNKYQTTVEYSTWVSVIYQVTAEAITLENDTTLTTGYSVLKAGSSLKSDGTTLNIYAIGNTGTPTTVRLANDITIGVGSIIKGGSTAAAGSSVNNGTLSANTSYASDVNITAKSTLKAGTLLYHGSVLESPETRTESNESWFDIEGDTAIGSGGVLASGSLVAIYSTINGTTMQNMLPQGVNYVLSPGEKIIVGYQDTSGAMTTKEYGSGTIIETNAEIGGVPSTQTSDGVILASGDYLRIKDRVKSSLLKGTPYYFVGNTTLSIPAKTSYRLGDQEYLIYTSSSLDELMILNPGTLLENNTSIAISDQFEQVELNDITSVESAVISWHALSTAIDAYDQEILSFGEGVTVRAASGTLSVGRDYEPLTAGVQVTQDGTTASYYKVIEAGLSDLPSNVYSARYTLNIAMTKAQQLQEGQFIWAGFTVGNNGTLSGGTVFAPPTAETPAGSGEYVVTPVTIEASEAVVLSGGEIWNGLNIDFTMYTETYAVDVLESATQASTGAAIDTLIKNAGSDVEHPTRLSDMNGGYIEVAPIGGTTYVYVRMNYTVSAPTLLPMYIRAVGENASWKIGVGSDLTAAKYMKGKPTTLGSEGVITGNENDTYNDRMYILYLEPIISGESATSRTNIYIIGTNVEQGSFIQIGKPYPIATSNEGDIASGLNADEIDVTNEDCVPGTTTEGTGGFVAHDVFVLGDTHSGTGDDIVTNAEALLQKIGELDANNEFDYTYKVPDDEKVIQPTKSENYFDLNHWANKYTIPKMDLARSMQRLIINPGQVIRG